MSSLTKMRKAQSMPLNTIIIAILVLIVLLVVGIIFGTRMGFFGGGLKSCATYNGNCETSCDGNEFAQPNTDCPKEERCCVDITKDAADVDD
jgi:hypothetical protein